MKNLILIALLSTLGLVTVQAEESNTETCKTYINEAKEFQSTMHEGNVPEATLAFYKDNVVSHCGNIASKMPYKKDFFAQELMKQENSQASNCKLAINMAKTYLDNKELTPFMVNAHKVNVADNCGTLVAKKVPAFCLFDVVETSTESLKEKCLASIDNAHAAKNTASLNQFKNDVVVSCGKLQASL